MLPLSSSPRLRALLVSLAIAAALLVYAIISAEPVLRVSLFPEEKPSIMRRKLKPLTDYLEKKIAMKIEFRPMANEDDLVNGLVANKVDLAWFSGLDFIQAKLRSNEQVIPIVQRVEDAQTRSVFVTARVDIAGLEDLKGRTFAFGAETSVSDHLMPRAFMREAFVDPDIEMKHVVYAGSPDVVVAAVSGGKVDAGVLSAAAWERMLANGKANAKVLHVFYTTPGYSDFNWTVRADMDANLRRELTSAFLSLDGGIGLDREILDLQRASRFIPADAENYTVIETVARSAGLLK